MKDPTVRGVVHLIEDTKTFGQKGFRKRLVVLEQSKGTFTNYIPVDFQKDACDEVDGLSVGDEIEVTYRLSGRRTGCRPPDRRPKPAGAMDGPAG
jgi:hypothetical protein